MSTKPEPIASAFAGLDEAALSYARKFNAIDDQGQLWCITCNREHGILPTLECKGCAERRRGRVR